MSRLEKWYIFTAEKDGMPVKERIPAENCAEATEELLRMGYAAIIFVDCFDF